MLDKISRFGVCELMTLGKKQEKKRCLVIKVVFFPSFVQLKI